MWNQSELGERTRIPEIQAEYKEAFQYQTFGLVGGNLEEQVGTSGDVQV